jgi:hypothetical protein
VAFQRKKPAAIGIKAPYSGFIENGQKPARQPGLFSTLTHHQRLLRNQDPAEVRSNAPAPNYAADYNKPPTAPIKLAGHAEAHGTSGRNVASSQSR